MTEIRVAASAELQPGCMLGVTLGDKRLALYRIGGRLYATDDICTHIYAFLSRGTLDPASGTVKCPMHGREFEIATGAARNDPFTPPLTTYRAVERNGELFVEID